MSSMGKDPRKEKQNPVEKAQQTVAAVAAVETVAALESLVERARKFHYLLTFAGDVVKPDIQNGQPCKAVEAVCRNCSIKGHYEKVCMKGKCSTHLVNVPEPSTSSDPNYFNEHGDPVYTHIVNVKEMNCKKHLIQFPISADLEKVRNFGGTFQDQVSYCSVES